LPASTPTRLTTRSTARLRHPHAGAADGSRHDISLVFSDLSVDRVVPGYTPFIAQDYRPEAGTR